MLIKIREVAVLINRHKSAVYTYMDNGLLPGPVKRDQTSKTQYWSTAEIVTSMPKVKAYQQRKNGDSRAKPKKKKTASWAGYVPKLTKPEQAANSAFNLCIN